MASPKEVKNSAPETPLPDNPAPSRNNGGGSDPRLRESRRVNRRFQYQVLAITAIVLAVLLLFSRKVYTDARSDIEEQFNRQQLLIADQASSKIASFLDELNASLRYSARFLRTVPPGHPGRMSSMAGLYERLGGRLRVSEVGYIQTKIRVRDALLREYSGLLSHCTPQNLVCFLIVQKKNTPDYLFAAAPVSGGVWIYAKVTLEDLDRSFVSPIQSGLKGRAWLLTSSGKILIAPGFRELEGTRVADLARRLGDDRLLSSAMRMQRGERGFDWHSDIRPGKKSRKRRMLTAFTPLLIGEQQWTLAVTAPSSEVGDLVRRTFRKGFLLTSFGFIVIISAALIILDRERRRIRAEDRLLWSGQVLESKQRLQALFDGITDSICILDKNFEIQLLNRGMAQLLKNEIPNLLYRPWGGGGESMIPEPLADRTLAAHTFETGRRGFSERSILMEEGKRLDLEIYTYPIFDADGNTQQVTLYIKDVTERRELQQQLTQKDRLTIVGKMSAQVAHEIRNPLSAINLNAELLEDELNRFEDEETREAWTLLRSIKQEVDILRQVTDDYLKFVRMPRSDRRVGDINELLEELLNFYAEEGHSRKVRVERVFSPDLPEVEMEDTQLRIAFQNLLRNAFDAMPEGGRLVVRTRKSHDEGVAVDIEDEGVGISAEDQSMIFTPFFTTKATGTGLGLALTQQILSEHHGTIRFSSQEKNGTTFHVELPAAAHLETKA
jgi:PAS domain S-box-containing protein